jgi:hypothetical protein
MVVLQALASSQEPAVPGHAAASVPTVAAVPVPLRPESAGTDRVTETRPQAVAAPPPAAEATPAETQAGETTSEAAPAPPAPKARRKKK